jgi:hypothetical protein
MQLSFNFPMCDSGTRRAVVFTSLACAFLSLSLAGCDVPPRPPIDPADILVDRVEPKTKEASKNSEPLESPSKPAVATWESWDAYFVKGKQVGYSHVSSKTVSDRATSDIQHSLENVTFVSQGNSRLLQHLEQTSVETFDGQLVSFTGNLKVGPAMTQFEGAVVDGALEIETVRGSSRSVRNIPWFSSYHGLVALEQTLRTKPMREKGDTRTIKMLVPGSYKLAKTRLRCLGLASVPLIDGSIADLVEIESEIQVDESRANYSTIWTNEKGEIQRTYSQGLHLVSYRTDKETATEFDGNEKVVSEVALEGQIDRPSEAKRIAFKVSSTPLAIRKGVPLEILPVPGQYIRKSDDIYDVLVSRRAENVAKGFIADSFVPGDADRQPSFFIDFKSSMVRRYADTAIGSQNLSPREAALELVQAANSLITNSDEFNGLVPASEVANRGEGDSTGQAILLAALLRTQKIPSQVVFGLKYVEGERKRMVYHAWTLAYVSNEWLHLDVTSGGLAPPDRIALAASNLNGRNEYDIFVPFLNAIGRMKIAVLGTQY